MSRVFLATATSLRRHVVVKVLPPELAAGINGERFRREIDVAAQLQHPHIVPLLEVGQSADLLSFTMPYIEGESLRALLEREGALPVGDAVRLWRELLDALSYAHGRGVVHRDIKPENVLLSGKHAMITDFGVARAVGVASGIEERMTRTGVALGTPAYMAPEQAAGEAHVGHRADLYASALVMWELLVGRHPFAGLNSQEMLSAHVTRTPPSLTDARTSVPPALAALVERCLAKNAADRPASADEVLAALDSISGSQAAWATTSPQASGTRHYRHWMVLAAAGAAVVVAVSMFAATRDGIASDSSMNGDDAIADSIAAAAAAQFRDIQIIATPGPPDDEPLRRQAAELVAETFRRDTNLWVGGPEQLRVIMRILRIPEQYAANPDTQAALLANGPYLVARVALSRFGSSFSVATTLIRNDRGSIVGTFRAEAPDSAALPRVLRQVADSAFLAYRRVSHELQRPPGSRFGSPAANKLLDESNERNRARDFVRAVHLARAATRADPDLPEAWGALANHLGNTGGNRAERLDALSRAYELRKRDGEIGEAFSRLAYWRALNRPLEALAALDSIAALSARYSAVLGLGPLNAENTAGLIRQNQREFAVAERHYRQAIALSRARAFGFAHTNLIRALLNQGNIAAADSLVHVIVSADSMSSSAHTAILFRADAVHDHEMMARTGERLLASGDTTSTTRHQAYVNLKYARMMQGRFTEAESLAVVDEQHHARIGDRYGALSTALQRARMRALLQDDAGGARQLMDEALQVHPPAAMPFMDRPYSELIATHTILGDSVRARALVEEWDRGVPAEYRNIDAAAIDRARGDIALLEGRPAEALQRYRTRLSGPCFTCEMPEIARAFDALQERDSAIAYYEQYVSTPNQSRSLTDAFELAAAYRRLGELHEEKGDLRQAIRRYEDFIELWNGADRDRQAIVTAVRNRVVQLRGRIG
jgi:serine/threonine-protein kinase